MLWTEEARDGSGAVGLSDIVRALIPLARAYRCPTAPLGKAFGVLHYSLLMLRQFTKSLTFETRGRGLFEITKPVADWVDAAGCETGLLTLFVRHTSASLLIQENADPDVCGDLDRFFARLVPDGDALFIHRDEGPDDMPAHIRAALTAVQLSVPLAGGRLVLGAWQGIYLWEHRLQAQRREVVLHILGE